MTLEDFFPYRLAVAAETFSRNLSQVYGREYGLSREEWRFLFLLADVPNMTSRELSRRTTLDKVQISRAAKRLEDKGYISSAVLEDDRRLRRYEISTTGAEVFRELMPQVKARTSEIISALSSDDLAALSKGLEALQVAAANRLKGDDT
ncbi:MarR family winged helix-turn-helix transcriptional regulator [Celeribacter sp.]|uniref:MarR family winged helix-turn-helix transcriptional regulator n=1 Tax=Celeribacter sp. TaxID=1890673 RepID=UPI003A9407C5